MKEDFLAHLKKRFSPKITVFVVEDDDDQYQQVEELLEKENFEPLRHKDYLNTSQIYHYLSYHYHHQIAIIDRNLGDETPEDVDGETVINEVLWPANRRMHFILFSVLNNKKPIEILSNRVGPSMTQVQKEVTIRNKVHRISEDSMETLKTVLKSCREVCAPEMSIPSYDIYDSFLALNAIHSKSVNQIGAKWAKAIFDSALKSIQTSIVHLNDFSKKAAYYRNTGMASNCIAIGMVGSCGRMEMRKNSDIEQIVFYLDERESSIRDLACSFWDRMRMVINNEGLEVEGEKKLVDKKTKLLNKPKLKTLDPGKYVPLIAVESLLLSKEELIREAKFINRHLQILLELRPVFNEELIFEMKLALITGYCQPKSLEDYINIGGIPNLNIRDIAHSWYFGHLIKQYFLSTQTYRLETLYDLKAVCFRLLNILATRLLLAGLVSFDPEDFKTEENWKDFFENLSAPGLVKIGIFFELWITNAKGFSPPELKKKIESKIKKIYAEYGKLLMKVFEEKSLDLRAKDLGQAEKNKVSSLLKEFIKLFELLGREEVGIMSEARELGWILDSGNIKELTNWLN